MGIGINRGTKARAITGHSLTLFAFIFLLQTPAAAGGDPNSGLLLAVRSNSIQRVQHELAKGADVNATDDSGMTALMYATFYGFSRIEIVRALLLHGANVNKADKTGRTALMLAADGKGGPDSDEIVKELLDRGANPNLKTWCGRTALMDAIQPALGKPRHEIVNGLLAKGADANVRINGEATILMVAARDGDGMIVRALLEHGADARAGDWEADHGGPAQCSGPLEWGAGHPEILKMLRGKGATSKPRCGWFSR